MQYLYLELKNEIKQIISKYETKIIGVVYKYFNKINNRTTLEQVNEYTEKCNEEVQKLFDELLEKIYSLIAKFVKQNYPKSDFDIDNIRVLTWNEDGVSLEERIKNHIQNAFNNALEAKIEKRDSHLIKSQITHQMIKILDTECFNLSNKVLNMKLKKGSKYFEILSSDCCGGNTGILPIHELHDLPPFHPNCQCMIIYYEEHPNRS